MKTAPFLFAGMLLAIGLSQSRVSGQDDALLGEGFFAPSPTNVDTWDPSFGSPQPMGLSANVQVPGGGEAIAEATTPEITALARGLESDPKRIFDFVHDHIRYSHYFGAHKGAELTLLERCGNDLDQCALLVALLTAAGYGPTYEFGTVSFPYASADHQDFQHWLRTIPSNTNWDQTLGLMTHLNVQGGFPYTTLLAGDTNALIFHHAWVQLNIGGTNYAMDPSFKVYEKAAGWDLGTAMGLDTNSLVSIAGGTATADYVQNLQEAALRTALQGYASTLCNAIQNNAPNASVEDIAGADRIISSASQPLTQATAFTIQTGGQNRPVSEWQYIPTNLMASITVAFQGTTNVFPIPALKGRRLSLSFDGKGLANLNLDDAPVSSVQTTNASPSVSVTLACRHPFGSWNFSGTNALVRSAWADQSVDKAYQRTNANYVVLYSFEPDAAWLTARQRQLDSYRLAGYAETSQQVRTETLNVMGLSWLLQTQLADQMLGRQESILWTVYHRLGRMAYETNGGYYVDAYAQLAYPISLIGTNQPCADTQFRVFQAASFFWSAMEHGMMEQMQSSNLTAASTIKILQLANTNSLRIFMAGSNNWSGIYSQLSNYSLSSFSNYVKAGHCLLLPSNGKVQIAGPGSWSGYGYVDYYTSGNTVFSGTTISGGYQGGFSAFSSSAPSSSVVAATSAGQSTFFSSPSALLPLGNQYGMDPVSLADGTFHIAQADLTLGGAEPRGLSLTRYYNSSRRNSNLTGMAGGWLHNYCCLANEVAAPLPALGSTTPQQMASMLVATRAFLSIFNNAQPDPKNWMISVLIAKWGIDQLTRNGVSINLGEDTIQFIKQPDGTFTPPANCTMTLAKSSGKYSLQERHGRTFNFDLTNRLASIVDPYANVSLTLAYQASNWVSQVSDWKGRTLTFGYSGTPQRLTSVTDNSTPNRSVIYGYATTYNSQGDLTSVTDPESKSGSYVYDANHQITTTIDALSQVVVSNIYDNFGRVTTQYTQGDTNKAWQIFWSGWQTVEQDPAGSKRRYFYDDKTRLIGQQDTLTNIAQMFYDGQDHLVASVSPLNETNLSFYDGYHNLLFTVDPLGYSNQCFYDASFNLYKSIDARGNPTTFGYNSKFQLTGQTNGAGDWVTFLYNSPDGTLQTKTDSAGSTGYTYDSGGYLSGITYPNSLGSEGFLNNACGDVLSHTNARQFVTSFQYNLRRQLTNTICSNLTNSAAFDAVGNVQSTKDARGFTTTMAWSPTRHLLSVTLPSTPQGTPVTTNGYDSRDWLQRTVNNPSTAIAAAVSYTNDQAGRLIAATDPIQRTSRFGYDADGRKISATSAALEKTLSQWDARGEPTVTTDNATHTIKRGYDPAGNQTAMTNRNGKPWAFQFDGANRLTNTITPLGRSTKVVFNNRGLLQTVTEPSTRQTSFNYDSRGRQTNRVDQVGATTYQYDLNNNLTNVFENAKTNSWTFDALDRVSSYRDSDGNLIQYRCDPAGNVTNLVYPGNRNVYYAFDSLNRLTNVTDWASRTTTFTYDLASHVTSIVRPNGTLRELQYDLAGQTTNIVERTTNNTPIAFFRLNWNSAARIGWEFMAPLPHTNALPSRTMTFDDDNRIATFKGPTMGSAASVGFDNDGNMTSGPLTNDTFATYGYDARNQLTNVGGWTYAYDSVGNRTAMTSGTNITRFVVNLNAKLSQVLMRSKNGVTNYYIYGAGLLYEITETTTTTNLLTYHYDYRGSTIAITDKNGAVTDRVNYSAYGLITWRTGATDTPFLYNGRYGVMTDPNGMYCMRARYYNPFICRFINPDPSGFAGGLNWYCFADGNPISLIDPFGLCAEEGWGGATASWIQDNVSGPLNSVSTSSTTLNFASYMAGSVIGGLGDLLRLGQGTANATYNAQDGWDVAIGITQDVGRAAGIATIVGGGLEGLTRDTGPSVSPYCFAADTKVSTPNGDVNIQDIRAGDTVYAYDFEGRKVVEETVETLHQNFTYHWVEVSVGGETILATKSHPFWVESEQRWFKAVDLKAGMEVRLRSGDAGVITSVKVDDFDQPETTYNFEVSHQHDYFVGRSAVLVHNGPTFVVGPTGIVFPVPPGAVGPTPVISRTSGLQTGVAFTGGSGGANGQVNTIRLMDPTLPRGASPGYPNGYVTYQNGVGSGAQAVDPYTGRTVPPSQAHYPCQ